MATLRKRARRFMKRYTNAWRDSIIGRSPPWARRHLAAPASYLDMLLVDHGIFRLLYVNRHQLGARAWRSAQPAPHHIRTLASEGVRTIVNLRGPRECGSYWLEQRACAKSGIALVNYQVRSRAAPSRAEIEGARALFERIEYPMLMHCKSGADRAGLMSTLYLHFREGLPIEEARRQLSLRFGHIRQADTGILDFFFDRYVADNARRPIPFREWIETVYDPAELARAFESRRWANVIVNGILRRE
jgi:protein tyrosine phosphatase (PTP) superfamily phosphohydrolase (DUF442 family)